MKIESYSGLITALGDWLNRTDLNDRAETFIQMAEKRLSRDDRVRDLARTPLEVSGGSAELPADFLSLETLTHTGDETAQIRMGSMMNVRDERRHRRSGGQPRVAAVEGDTLYLGPSADRTYDMELVYWRGFTPLGTGNLSNWLLAEHPDIYLYSSLVESAPYIREDTRIEVWNMYRETALEELRLRNESRQFDGPLNRYPTEAIGERMRNW